MKDIKIFRQTFWFNLLIWDIPYFTFIFIIISEIIHGSLFNQILVSIVIYLQLVYQKTKVEVLEDRVKELENK